jgi:citrate lyase subunit beta/citryl-CoA lyase
MSPQEVLAARTNTSMMRADEDREHQHGRNNPLQPGSTLRMIRSLLYVPASAPRFVGKAHERGADAVVLDLEDSVAPGEKDAARAALRDAVPAVGRNGAQVFVRVNAEEGRLHADVEAACRAGAIGLFLPKSRDPAELAALADWIAGLEQQLGRAAMQFVPMLEDPGAILDARAIARATPRVLGLITGAEDLATAMGAEPIPELLRLPKLLVHLAAKAAGVLSFGLMRTVADFQDVDGITASAQESRRLGFDGSTCIHPSVVPILNAAFSPTEAELDHARRMVAAFDDARARGIGAFTFEGRMVDLPVVARARQTLGLAPVT